MRTLKFIVRVVTGVENILVIILGATITVSVFLGVFFRYVLRDPLIWSGELALICFAWFIFLGAGLATKHKAHMSIDALERYFPESVSTVLRPVTLVLIMFLLVILVFFGFKHSFSTYNIKTTALQLPWSYVFLSVPVGSLMMLAYMVEDFVDFFRMQKDKKRLHTGEPVLKTTE
jgi:TRAP-type C4-dicarboxylate transport system permease small subunit